MLETTDASARQLHHRARQRLSEPAARFWPDPARWRELVDRFWTASRGGDMAGLVTMLTADVTSTADGGRWRAATASRDTSPVR